MNSKFLWLFFLFVLALFAGTAFATTIGYSGGGEYFFHEESILSYGRSSDCGSDYSSCYCISPPQCTTDSEATRASISNWGKVSTAGSPMVECSYSSSNPSSSSVDPSGVMCPYANDPTITPGYTLTGGYTSIDNSSSAYVASTSFQNANMQAISATQTGYNTNTACAGSDGTNTYNNTLKSFDDYINIDGKSHSVGADYSLSGNTEVGGVYFYDYWRQPFDNYSGTVSVIGSNPLPVIADIPGGISLNPSGGIGGTYQHPIYPLTLLQKYDPATNTWVDVGHSFYSNFIADPIASFDCGSPNYYLDVNYSKTVTKSVVQKSKNLILQAGGYGNQVGPFCIDNYTGSTPGLCYPGTGYGYLPWNYAGSLTSTQSSQVSQVSPPNARGDPQWFDSPLDANGYENSAVDNTVPANVSDARSTILSKTYSPGAILRTMTYNTIEHAPPAFDCSKYSDSNIVEPYYGDYGPLYSWAFGVYAQRVFACSHTYKQPSCSGPSCSCSGTQCSCSTPTSCTCAGPDCTLSCTGADCTTKQCPAGFVLQDGNCINLNTNPVCTLTGNPNPALMGDTNIAVINWSAQLTLNGCVSGGTPKWDLTGNNSNGSIWDVKASSTAINYTRADPYYANATYSDDNCFASCTSTVVVQNPLSVTCSFAPNPILVTTNPSYPKTATATAIPKGGSGGYTYLWGGVLSGGSSSASASFDTIGDKSASVTVTDSSGATAHTSCDVNVNDVIVTCVSSCTTSPCVEVNQPVTWSVLQVEGLSMMPIGYGTGSTVHYLWDGNADLNQSTLIKSFDANGTYSASVTVTTTNPTAIKSVVCPDVNVGTNITAPADCNAIGYSCMNSCTGGSSILDTNCESVGQVCCNPVVVPSMSVNCSRTQTSFSSPYEVNWSASVSNGSSLYSFDWNFVDFNAPGYSSLIFVKSGVSLPSDSNTKLYLGTGEKDVNVRVTGGDGNVAWVVCGVPVVDISGGGGIGTGVNSGDCNISSFSAGPVTADGNVNLLFSCSTATNARIMLRDSAGVVLANNLSLPCTLGENSFTNYRFDSSKLKGIYSATLVISNCSKDIYFTNKTAESKNVPDNNVLVVVLLVGIVAFILSAKKRK